MSNQENISANVIRQSIDVYIILGLVTFFGYVSFKLIAPFISVLLWAGILAIALYPVFAKLASVLGGRRKIASALIGLFSLILLLAPVTWLGQSALESSTHLVQEIEVGTFAVPAPNESVKDWPLIGERIFNAQNNAHNNLQKFLAENAERLKALAGKVIGASGMMIISVGQFALSIIFASVFVVYATPLRAVFKQLAQRINPNNGDHFIDITITTTRNVSKAVVGIAVVQSVLGAIGFFMVGLPFAGLWSGVLFGTALISLPILVILPSIIYTWSVASTLTAILFTAFMLPVMLIDNVMRPIIAAKGLATPMIVIFMGVIGGAISFGLMGLFVGPVILAVFYEMVGLWARNKAA